LAFFALNDYIGWGVYKACQELDLKIPDDVSIVCFDDSDITQAMTPPITVVAQRTEQIAQKAAELLERRLMLENKEQSPEHTIIDVDLIERESVAHVN
jgi:LacI family transcriptional regulator